MKKTIFTAFATIALIAVIASCTYSATRIPAKDITVDASGFSGNLGPTDTDVQHALNTIDQLIVGGSQTPWTSDIDGGGYRLSNVGSITTTGEVRTGDVLLGTGVDVGSDPSKMLSIYRTSGGILDSMHLYINSSRQFIWDGYADFIIGPQTQGESATGRSMTVIGGIGGQAASGAGGPLNLFGGPAGGYAGIAKDGGNVNIRGGTGIFGGVGGKTVITGLVDFIGITGNVNWGSNNNLTTGLSSSGSLMVGSSSQFTIDTNGNLTMSGTSTFGEINIIGRASASYSETPNTASNFTLGHSPVAAGYTSGTDSGTSGAFYDDGAGNLIEYMGPYYTDNPNTSADFTLSHHPVTIGTVTGTYSGGCGSFHDAGTLLIDDVDSSIIANIDYTTGEVSNTSGLTIIDISYFVDVIVATIDYTTGVVSNTSGLTIIDISYQTTTLNGLKLGHDQFVYTDRIANVNGTYVISLASGSVGMAGSLTPFVNNSQDIGTSIYSQWQNIYCQVLRPSSKRIDVGSQLVSNGSFASSAGWTWGANGEWAPAGSYYTWAQYTYDLANIDSLSQQIATTAGKTYRISLQVPSYGNWDGTTLLKIKLGTSGDPDAEETVVPGGGSPSHTVYLVSHADNETLYFIPVHTVDAQPHTINITGVDAYQSEVVSIYDTSGGLWSAGSSDITTTGDVSVGTLAVSGTTFAEGDVSLFLNDLKGAGESGNVLTISRRWGVGQWNSMYVYIDSSNNYHWLAYDPGIFYLNDGSSLGSSIIVGGSKGGQSFVGPGGYVIVRGGEGGGGTGTEAANGGSVTLYGGAAQGAGIPGSVIITGKFDPSGITGNVDWGANNNTTTGQSLAGSVILTNTSTPATVAGTIYFDGTHFQGWNGTAWKQLDN